MALSFSPACLPLPRFGAPSGAAEGGAQRGVGPRALAAFSQRGHRQSALALGIAGFPGLVLELDRERAWVNRHTVERQVDRIGLAFLRAEHGAGAPPAEQLSAAVEQLRQAEHGRPRAIKVELPGPISLALLITDDQERPLAYDPMLREVLAQYLTMRAVWLREMIESAGATALLVFDEPFLEALGSPVCPLDWNEGGDLLARTLAYQRGQRGLAVAGAPNWENLVSLPVDVLFFDAYEHSASLVQSAKTVAPFLERGGAFGWGVVPTDPTALAQEQASTLAQRIARSIDYVAAVNSLPAEQLVARSLISTSSGLAHLPVNQALQAMSLCVETAATARTMFNLDS